MRRSGTGLERTTFLTYPCYGIHQISDNPASIHAEQSLKDPKTIVFINENSEGDRLDQNGID